MHISFQTQSMYPKYRIAKPPVSSTPIKNNISFGQYYSFKDISQFIKDDNMDKLKDVSNLSVVNENSQNLLHISASENKPKITEYLVKNKISVNQPDINGNTPLHFAVPYANCVDVLLKNGANPYLKNKEGLPALITSAYHLDSVDLLLKNKVNPNCMDNNEQTLFHVAAKLGDVALGQKLLEYKAEVNFKDKFGNTPIFYAQDEKFIQFLKEAKADLNAQNKDGDTPLIKFTKENNPDCILGLLQAGAKSNFQNNEDKTAILYARNNVIRELLLDGNADPDARLEDRRTLLHVAANVDQISLAELLLRYKASPSLKDKNNSTPLSYAQSNKMRELLLKNGADPNELNYLILALMTNDKEFRNILLSHKADVNMPYEEDGSTPIFYCLDTEDIDLLVKRNADINHKDKDGNTAMHRYMLLGRKDLAQYLEKLGADNSIKNSKQKSPYENFISWEKYNTWIK